MTIESTVEVNTVATANNVSEVPGSSTSISSEATKTEYRVNITLSERFAKDPPPGGIALRIRAPGYLVGQRITAATVGGKALPSSAINASAETVYFSTLPTVALGMHGASTALQNIVVTVS